jgi:MSHA pilin protein MshD
MCTRPKQRGVSLVELIMFIVIVSAALAGILMVMNVTEKGSADPLVHKQALAIAESMIEEVELMPFTFCDPDDANATTATSPMVGAGGCATMLENLGVENDVSRYDPTFPYDNVSDYNNFHMTPAGGIQDITNNTVLTGYDALVTITQPGLGGIAGTETLLIKVTVTGPDNFPVTLEGFRTRYSPRTVP